MASQLNRRDFLKLSTTLSLAAMLQVAPLLGLDGALRSNVQDRPNIIIILFDALSARHLSLNGYPRKTTPNIDHFANRSTVYHAHHAVANYTTPSTASLLSGTYPWTHRAFQIGGLIRRDLVPHNIFHLLAEIYQRSAIGMNWNADTLLYQFDQYLDKHVDIGAYCMIHDTIYNRWFRNDPLIGLRSFDGFLFGFDNPGSLTLSWLQKYISLARYKLYQREYARQYPSGLPEVGTNRLTFSIEAVVDGVSDLLDELQQPFFAYLHLWPPHAPYRPRAEFSGLFKDGWAPPKKPVHPLSLGESYERLKRLRQRYDEYIAHVDSEFGRLLEYMQISGLLDNSYVILTSDHGELFERGTDGHNTPLLYEPLLHIPLLIARPGQQQRQDVHTLTSNLDLLPTLLQISGMPAPEWAEGVGLLDFGGQENAERDIFAVEAKTNSSFAPLTSASVSLISGQFKLIHYFGYPGFDAAYEMYDLENDPEEMHNQVNMMPEIAGELKSRMEAKLEEVNKPYRRG
jgi:arylsulfatase A-like enzyme